MKPSDFAAMGQPCCSCWGKSELEWIALAYVRALANDGDIWKRLSRREVWELLTEEQKAGGGLYSVLGIDVELDRDLYGHWFDRVANRITDADGAWSVGGFWNPHRYAMVTKDASSTQGKSPESGK